MNIFKWIGYKIEGLSKYQPCKQSIKPLDKMQSVLVLTDEVVDAQLNSALKKLQQTVPNAILMQICYTAEPNNTIETDKQQHSILNHNISISNGDIGFFYTIKNEKLKDMLTPEYDAIFLLTLQKNKVFEYLMPFLRAPLIVATQGLYSPYPNIIINSRHSSVDELAGNIEHTLKMLFSPKN